MEAFAWWSNLNKVCIFFYLFLSINVYLFIFSSYAFENIFYHVLKKRIAKFSPESLTKMWSSNHTRWMVIEYMTKRVVGTLEILDKLDMIGRTAELAKLFGIQFLEVLSRGSQFRVESIMLRLVRAKNFVPVSPTIQVRNFFIWYCHFRKKKMV